MSGPKRNADSINTIGIVVVGICGAVMVYVSITALQAFYMNDTSELQTMQDYGGQDTVAKSHKAEEMRNINEPAIGTNSITIERAMAAVVKSAGDAHAAGKPATALVPGACEQTMPTEIPQPGRPTLDVTRIGGCKGGIAPPPKPTPPAGSSGSDAGAGSGSAAPATGNGKTDGKAAGKAAGNGANIQLHSTGGGPGDTHAVAGAGGAPVGATNGSNSGSAAKLAPGGHAP
ncbi:MAG: hypothetical protein ABI591_17410 [Kofleriaceae bacterium]